MLMPRKNKGGRPRISDAEKARRGTLQPSRARDVPATREDQTTEGTSTERDYVGIARRYAADVLSGRILACQWVKLACERQDRDVIRAETDPSCPFIWSDTHAVDACHFIEQLPHVEGKWSSPFIVLE